MTNPQIAFVLGAACFVFAALFGFRNKFLMWPPSAVHDPVGYNEWYKNRKSRQETVEWWFGVGVLCFCIGVYMAWPSKGTKGVKPDAITEQASAIQGDKEQPASPVRVRER